MISQDFCQALNLLKAGGVVAVPTETVYGLAADALDDKAVAQIYALKERPTFNPLICHVAGLEEAERYGIFNKDAHVLARAFWPGPLTLVVKQKPGAGISRLATCGLDTVGLRVPNHPVMRDLLRQIGRPLAAPSANASGLLSPTSASHVMKSLGNDVFVLDGGPCAVGIESTIVDVSGDSPMLLRPGVITLEALRGVLPDIRQKTVHEAINAPGQLLSHYAPRLPLRLDAGDALSKGEALLAFGPVTQKGYKTVVNLSEKADLLEAAARLFDALHSLDDDRQFSGIAVGAIPVVGIGMAINDRLQRAAHR